MQIEKTTPIRRKGKIMEKSNKSFVVLCVLCVVFGVPFCFIQLEILGWVGSTAKVVHDEFGAKAILEKYTYLKSIAAQLTSKKNNIIIASRALKTRKLDNPKPMSEWARDEREAYWQREAELIAMKSNYNNLVAEYNQLMSQLNWKFAYSNQLPHGADEVLHYSSVKGKVSSSGKRLTPTTATTVNTSGMGGVPFTVDGKTYYSEEMLQDDGTYGSSAEYIYWFDQNDIYHQHLVSGSAIVHISDQPIKVQRVMINMENQSSK